MPRRFRQQLRVAREEAILACDLYNQRRRERHLEGFVIHMEAAWLNLFVALAIKHGVDYRMREDGKIQRDEGEPKRWDIEQFIEHFFPEKTDPVRANLEFFLRFRKKIENRFSARQLHNIEMIVAAKTQANVLNFEKYIVSEFGPEHSVGETLRFPLFLSTLTEDPVQAATEIYEGVPARLRAFIEEFDRSQSPEVRQSEAYEFRMYIMPKTSSDGKLDLALEFVDLAKMTQAQRGAIENARVIIRDRHVETVNMDRVKAGVVVERVKLVYPEFSLYHHTLAWKYYGVRPSGQAGDPARTDSRYCVYDIAHRDYLYTDAWVEKLENDLRTGAAAMIERWKTGQPLNHRG